MPPDAALITRTMLADTGLFAGGALVLALVCLAAPAERRRGIIPLAVVAAVGLSAALRAAALPGRDQPADAGDDPA